MKVDKKSFYICKLIKFLGMYNRSYKNGKAVSKLRLMNPFSIFLLGVDLFWVLISSPFTKNNFKNLFKKGVFCLW